MTNAFLNGVAQKINDKHDGDFKDVIILSPNRRAGLFLQKELNQLQEQPIWSPRLFTIDDWVRHHSAHAEADRLSCIYRLYQIWKSRVKAEEKFENFYFWGDRLMNDFDLINKYLVNEERLFSIITEEKEIEAQFGDWEEELKEYLHQFWSSIEPKTAKGDEHEQIKAFLKLWRQIGDIKRELEKQLIEDNIAHSGMMYRALARELKQLDKWKGNDIYIVGFNRLNRCEKRIIQYCLNELKGTAYWNYDKHLLTHNSDYNDAGRFLKKNKLPIEESGDLAADWASQAKEINFYGVIRQAGQAKFIGEILEQSDVSFEDTMIVLPDETLLLPLLGALPEELSSVNISMGVALKETPIYTLVEAYLNLHQHYDVESQTYHRSDVLKVMGHPYVPKNVPPIRQVHVEWSDLEQIEGEIVQLLFQPLSEQKAADLFTHLLEAMKQMHKWHVEHQVGGSGLAEYNAEVIVFAYQRIRRLKSIYEEQQMKLDFPALIKLIRHYFKNARIPFKGEPLEGLQILGPLEARNLDFDQVIIPNMNEGIFPGTTSNSLIPFHLQKAFGLPTYEDEMAEYAYYFYMALARAPQAHLLYNVLPDDIGAKEQSRFLQNLMILDLPNWDLRDRQQIQEAGLKPPSQIVIQKDDSIRNAIRKRLQKGVSPSAINTYMLCQLKFYFRYIEKLEESKSYEEGFRSENIGKVLHKGMELLYADLRGQEVTEQKIEALKNSIEETVEQAVKMELGIHTKFQKGGEVMLVKKLVCDYVLKVLEYDQQRAPFRLLDHEKEVANSISVNSEYLDKITIKGRIDRLDEKEGVLTISDYKSGNVGYSNSSGGRIYGISSLLDIEESQRHKEALQLFLYALALDSESTYKDKALKLGLYTLRELSKAEEYDNGLYIQARYKKPIEIDFLTEEHKDEFKQALSKLVDHMLDPEIEINQTEDEKICQYCPYIQICKRR